MKHLIFCLLLALLACSKKPEPEYGSVCYVENYYLAQDADGGALEIADARRGIPPPGRPAGTPKYLTFPRKGGLSVDWQGFDFIWVEQLEYRSGSPKAKVIDPLDGGVTSYPIRVEGSPPKSVTFGYHTEICLPPSPPALCTDMTEEKSVYVTYTCKEEQL